MKLHHDANFNPVEKAQLSRRVTRKARNGEKTFPYSPFLACGLLLVPAICGADSGLSLALAQSSLLSPRAYAAQVFTQTGARIQFQGRTDDLHLSPLIEAASLDAVSEHLASQLATVSHTIVIDREAEAIHVTLLEPPSNLSSFESFNTPHDSKPHGGPNDADIDEERLAAIKRDYEALAADRSLLEEVSPPSSEGLGITLAEVRDAVADYRIEREAFADDEELSPGGHLGRGMTRESVRALIANYKAGRSIARPYTVVSPPGNEGRGITAGERDRIVRAFSRATTDSDDMVSPGMDPAAGMTRKQVQDAIDAYLARITDAQ